MGSNTKAHHKLHSKAMVIFKEMWGKLYYTQHILLSNMWHNYPFFLETHTHGKYYNVDSIHTYIHITEMS